VKEKTMKVLLIGMDGCHKDVFERGWTPFISSLLEKQRHLEIYNDLLSRGWLEISLGEHAIKTKALYDKPKADGSLEWTKNFSLPDVPGIGTQVKGLWQKLNEQGYSVGIVNVPTTYPAPEVNGFFISGGGGGAPVVENATEELCYPSEILPILEENGYIVDNRLYELVVDKKLTMARKILQRLSYKNEKRTDTFIELDEKYKVDFGFIVYRTASVVAESFYNAEMCRRRNPENVSDEAVMAALAEYYEHFDKQVERLLSLYPDTSIVFVSDHGTTQRTHDVNPNVLLREAGLQVFDYKKATTKQMVTKAKSLVPFSVKSLLKKHVSKAITGLGDIDFDASSTKAFCRTVENWTHGVYINDHRRFGGPVKDKDFESIRAKVIECINAHPDSVKHGVSAVAASPDAGKKYDYYPDVQIKTPDGYLTFDGAKTYLSEYVPPECDTALDTFMKGEMLYMKSHAALAYIDDEAAATFKDEDLRGNLTVIHHRILDIMAR